MVLVMRMTMTIMTRLVILMTRMTTLVMMLNRDLVSNTPGKHFPRNFS